MPNDPPASTSNGPVRVQHPPWLSQVYPDPPTTETRLASQTTVELGWLGSHGWSWKRPGTGLVWAVDAVLLSRDLFPVECDPASPLRRPSGTRSCILPGLLLRPCLDIVPRTDVLAKAFETWLDQLLRGRALAAPSRARDVPDPASLFVVPDEGRPLRHPVGLQAAEREARELRKDLEDYLGALALPPDEPTAVAAWLRRIRLHLREAPGTAELLLATAFANPLLPRDFDRAALRLSARGAPYAWRAPDLAGLLTRHLPHENEVRAKIETKGHRPDDFTSAVGRLAARFALQVALAWHAKNKGSPWERRPSLHGKGSEDDRLREAADRLRVTTSKQEHEGRPNSRHPARRLRSTLLPAYDVLALDSLDSSEFADEAVARDLLWAWIADRSCERILRYACEGDTDRLRFQGFNDPSWETFLAARATLRNGRAPVVP
ncbi:MAG: hypothetical protein RLZZ383_3035 [Pseudomonadota bacterium]